jgi:hypothetical protein
MLTPLRAARAALLAAAVLSPAPALAQAAPQKSKRPAAAATPEKPATKSSAPKAEADPLAEARRQTAVNLINSLAEEARDFRDPVLRARVQMQVAQSVWEAEPKRARTLFRRAWEAAVAGDRENERVRDENIREQLRTRGAAVHADIPKLKEEVLRAAARRDPALGQEFLKSLDDERAGEDEAAPAPTEGAPAADARTPDYHARFQAPPVAQQRLKLAREFLLTDETARAVEFAAPALTQISTDSVAFLSFLRQTDAAAADRLFAALVARAQADPASDANTASVLSSYVFAPGQFSLVFRDGSSTRNSRDSFPPPDLSPALRASFMRAAASMLLRPLPPPDQDRTTAGRFGTLRLIQEMLPLFERHAPEHTGQLHARLSNLIEELPNERRRTQERDRQQALARERAAPQQDRAPGTPRPEESDEVDKIIERAGDVSLSNDERDLARVRAAMLLSQRGDLRAREHADRIDDRALRQQTREYVDFDLARPFRGDDPTGLALEIARGDTLPPIKRVWLLVEAARLASDEQRVRAVGLLEEAASIARRIDAGDADRPRALTAVATRMLDIDPERVWVLLGELVKAANSAESFTGSDARLVSQLQTKRFSTMSDHDAPEFNLTLLFSRLAAADLDRAAEHARAFANESPRAAATLAAARAVLEKKPTPPTR